MKIRNCFSILFSLLLVGAGASAQESKTAPGVEPMQKLTLPAPRPVIPPAPGVKLIENGSVAPDFISNDLVKAVRLSDWKGKVVVLDFWATWCGPCMQSLPHTQEIAKRYKDQGLVVLACCTSDTRANFEKWVKKNQKKYPDIVFTCDPNERGSATYEDRASKKLYGLSGIPTQFIIAADGKITATVVGYNDSDNRLEMGLAKAGLKVEASKAGGK